MGWDSNSKYVNGLEEQNELLQKQLAASQARVAELESTRGAAWNRERDAAREETRRAQAADATSLALYQSAHRLLREVKVWRDGDGNDSFPHSLRTRIDAALCTPAILDEGCQCPFAQVVDGKIVADERARSWHVWKYLAHGLARHLIAILGIDVVKKAHGCGEGHERNVWLDEMAAHTEMYANTPWCMPAPSDREALGKLAERWRGYKYIRGEAHVWEACARELLALCKSAPAQTSEAALAAAQTNGLLPEGETQVDPGPAAPASSSRAAEDQPQPMQWGPPRFAWCRTCRGVLSGTCGCVMHQDGVDTSVCVAHRGHGHVASCSCAPPAGAAL